jgi:DivIVA domain-containing protein
MEICRRQSEEATPMKRHGSALFERIAHAEAQGAEEDVSSGMLDMEEAHPAMTPDAIRFQHFGVQLLRGLNPEEVRAFLYVVAEEWETVQRANRALETQIRRLKDEVQMLTIKASTSLPDVLRGAEPQTTAVVPAEQNEAAATTRLEVLRSAALQEVEALLHDAQARGRALTDAAQERAANIVHEAEALKSQQQQEADEMVAEATATAESIMMAARREEAALRQDLDHLAESRLRLFDDVRATLDACHKWLATVDPRSRRLGPERNVSSESVTNGALSTVDETRWTDSSSPA